MDDDITARVRTRAAAYVELVDMMRGGQYADDEEWRALSSQRTLTHDALIRLTGVTDRKAMDGYYCALLAGETAHTPTEMAHTQTIPGTATKIALDRLLAALSPEDAAVLEWFAATTRAYQRARGEPARADATDALIAMLRQGLAEQRRAKGIAEAFAAEPGGR